MPSNPNSRFNVLTEDSRDGLRLFYKMRSACLNPLSDPVLFAEPHEGDVIYVDSTLNDGTCLVYLWTEQDDFDDSDIYTFFIWELELLGIDCSDFVFTVTI